MIYIVKFNRRALAETQGARLICMSGDGTEAMMQSDNDLTVEIVSKHQDSEQNSLMSLDFWRQPCKNC